MNEYKFYMTDSDPRALPAVTWTRHYKSFTAARAELTRAVKRFMNVYGHAPDVYGVKTVWEGL